MGVTDGQALPADCLWYLLSLATQALFATLLVVFLSWSNSWHDINEALAYFFGAHWQAVPVILAAVGAGLAAATAQCAWLCYRAWATQRSSCLASNDGAGRQSDQPRDELESFLHTDSELLPTDPVEYRLASEDRYDSDNDDLVRRQCNSNDGLVRRQCHSIDDEFNLQPECNDDELVLQRECNDDELVLQQECNDEELVLQRECNDDRQQHCNGDEFVLQRECNDDRQRNNDERRRQLNCGWRALHSLRQHWQTSIHWLHWAFVVALLVAAVCSYVLLSVVYAEEWGLYYRFMQVSLPLAQLLLALGCSAAVLLVHPLLSAMRRLRWTVAFYCAALLYAAVLVFVLTAPLWIDSPNVRDAQQPFGPAPQLFAHRGASSLAPENTVAAYQRVGGMRNVYALESDVHWTSDFHPVLMHDDSLFRTTNVAQVFPGRQRDPVESFTYAELQQLDAGSWFVDSDPFGTIRSGAVSAAEAQRYRGAAVPSFADYVRQAVALDMPFLWDNYGTDNGGYLHCRGVACAHPTGNISGCLSPLHCRGRPGNWYLQLTHIIAALNASHLARFYLYPVVDDRKIAEIRALAPAMHFAYYFDSAWPLHWATAGRGNYTLWNAPVGVSNRAIAMARRAYPEVVVHVVNERWVVDQAWLVGAGYVLSNVVQNFAELGAQPDTWTMSYAAYYCLWLSVDALAIAIVVGYLSYRHGYCVHRTCR